MLPLLTRVWEPQARGAAHVHPVFALASPDDARIAFLYFEHLARLAPKHGFGFVGTKKGSSAQIMSGERAAAYLSSYFVRGSKEKATLQENARNPYMPHLLIWVSPKLTKLTGITMRILRRIRHLWAVRMGLCPPPSWPADELVHVNQARRPLAAARTRAVAAGAVPVPKVRPAWPRGRGRTRTCTGRLSRLEIDTRERSRCTRAYVGEVS